MGRRILKVHPDGLRLLARTAFDDVAFFLRPTHLQQLRDGLDDPADFEAQRLLNLLRQK